MQVIAFRRGSAEELENELKIVGVDFNLPHTPFHIEGSGNVTSRGGHWRFCTVPHPQTTANVPNLPSVV
jgi:hypothetical protein